MDLPTLAAKLAAIDEHEKRIADLEVMLLDLSTRLTTTAPAPQLQLVGDETAGGTSTDEPKPEAQARELVRRIEQHIKENIRAWKWSRPVGSDAVSCPLTASDLAQRLNLDTDQVRMLIKDPGLWSDVYWTMGMLPHGHPESVRCNRARHVVARVKALPNV